MESIKFLGLNFNMLLSLQHANKDCNFNSSQNTSGSLDIHVVLKPKPDKD